MSQYNQTQEQKEKSKRNLEIANIIMKQMGGIGKITAMIGMNGLCAIENGVRFKFKGSKIANYCSVVLNDNDTYTLKLSKLWGMKETVKLEESGLYFDQLKPIFEQNTKLYLSL